MILRIVVNLVILKKSADSDETDDSMYAVDSSDHGEYEKSCYPTGRFSSW